MKISYTCHRVSFHEIETNATLPSGEQVVAKVQGLEVELVPVDNPSGTVTLRYVGDAIAPAMEIFSEGAVVVGIWTKEGE